jgi:hypothetical protein
VGKVYHIPAQWTAPSPWKESWFHQPQSCGRRRSYSDAGHGRMSVMPADRPTPLPAFLHSPTWKEDCAGLSGIDTIESLVD